MREERAVRRRRTRRQRQPGLWTWAGRAALGICVALLLLTDITDNLRRSAQLLWQADLGRAFASPSGEGPQDPEALKSEIATLLNHPELIREATGVEAMGTAGFRFDGCELVLEIASVENACEGEVPEDAVRSVEWRHDLRNYVLHPFLQPEKVPVVARETGPGVKAVMSYPMVPSVMVPARLAYEGFLLSDPVTLDSPDPAVRLEKIKTMTESIDAGELGLYIQQNRERTTFCDGSEAVRPVMLNRLLLLTQPRDGERLRDRLHVLSDRVCPARPWLFNLGR